MAKEAVISADACSIAIRDRAGDLTHTPNLLLFFVLMETLELMVVQSCYVNNTSSPAFIRAEVNNALEDFILCTKDLPEHMQETMDRLQKALDADGQDRAAATVTDIITKARRDV
tara:strand:+ start:6233 stop:6577 length:345 start_codon:yes stop_codon:yes gene_type:complete